MNEIFFKKEPILGFICCENTFTISPANANRKQDFQKKTTDSSKGMEGKAIIEAKKSITQSMTESDEKRRRKTLQATTGRRGEGPSKGQLS